MPPSGAGPLEGVRVLDLTTEMGQYCGKLLADLGADVINVEPPGGDPARGVGPFLHDDVSREGSLSYRYLNGNKRSVTCDIDQHDGQYLLTALVKTSDVLVESFAVGRLDARGIGYRQLQAVRPGLIYVSISGFGLTGPHRDWAAPDIVGLAMSGALTLAGDPADPPNVLAGQQGYICASIAGAQGAILALLHRDRGGTGQLVEVSMQEALSMAQETAMMYWDFQQIARERTVGLKRVPGQGTYKTSDGYVTAAVGVVSAGAPFAALRDWMAEEGKAEELTEPAWVEFLDTLSAAAYEQMLQDPARAPEAQRKVARGHEIVGAFFAGKSSRECYEEGQRRDLLIAMVASPKDLLESPQLRERGWFSSVDLDGTRAPYPGMPYRFSDTPLSLRRSAPTVGQHNIEVWVDEAGIPKEDLAAYAAEGAL